MYTERFRDEWNRPGETLWVPDDGSRYNRPADHAQHEALVRDALERIPMDGTELVPHPISGDIAIKAPEGKAFRMTGTFQTLTESNSFDHSYRPPTSSTDAWAVDPQNGSSSVEELHERFGIREIDYFDGKYITVGKALSRRNNGGGDDEYRKHYHTRWDSSDDGPMELEVRLHSDDYRFFLEGGTFQLNLGEEDDAGTLYEYEVDDVSLIWTYEYGFTDATQLAVELVGTEHTHDELELLREKNHDKLWKPLWALDDDEIGGLEFAKMLLSAFRSNANKRYATPYEELVLVTGHVDIDEAVSRIEAGESLTRQWVESGTPEGRELSRRKYEDKKARMLTIIEGGGYIPIHQLAREFSAPDWFKNRLAPDIRQITGDNDGF